MPPRLTVVVSQSRSQNPKKRELEEALVAELLGKPGVDVTVVSHLYDLTAEGTDMLCLSGITDDLVVCSWLYPRGARWILARNAVLGQEGISLLKSLGDDEEDVDDSDEPSEEDVEKSRVIDQVELPQRKIYCLDLRAYDSAAVFVEEVQRIAGEQQTSTVELTGWINGEPKPEQMQRYLSNGKSQQQNEPAVDPLAIPHSELHAADSPARRWYPVIDLSRCTNCLECIDFCLFGVYGIDSRETILVEQPDNCRQGCPACSRVCPENAIIFPQHKSPIIAGSPEVGESLKIDLSQLFGAPDPGAPGAEKSLKVAANERDEQLLLAGREPVGMAVGIPRRRPETRADSDPKDQLDRLIDAVDQAEL